MRWDGVGWLLGIWCCGDGLGGGLHGVLWWEGVTQLLGLRPRKRAGV